MISRGQMYRQLYMGGGIGSLDAGAPSIKYTGNIDSQMASAPDPMDALNDLAMQLFGKPLDLLTPDERQALDEYNSGMMAVGGRVNYGIGSKLKKFVKKAGDVIMDVADPVAQALAVIPNPYQPYAQAYTGIRSTGIGGDYQGLQVGGYTPGAYGGQYGLNPFSSGNIFQTQGIIPTFDATNPNTGESIFNPDGTLKSGSTTSSSRGFFEKAKKAAEGIKSVYDQVSDSVSGQEIYRKAQEAKKQKSIPDTVKDILLDTALGKNRDDGLRRGTSAYLAKKAYDDQVRYNELLKKQYEDYIAATGAARTKFADKSKLKGYEVTGVPRTARDVVRAPVMGGGIMNTRRGYNMGGFEGLFQDTIGTTMLGPNIEDEIMRRARKFMQMTDDVDAAYKMAEMEFMSELESKYPGFYEGIGTLPEDLSETVNKQLKAYGGRMGYAGGTIDKDYEAWKRMYEKSQDAAEGLNPIKNQEYIQRYKQEKNNRTKYAIGGDTSEPISSFEQNTMMASPDWYVKRVEILMELGYDYDTASEIAYDSDRYYDTVGGMNKGGRPGYALGDTATMAAQVEGLPLRNNQAGITELDLRDSGGFIPPVGIKEKADDIPAMLSNNEFVFTADAVKGMGDGDVDVGAQRMYDIMKKLEKGGRV
jgi:hypothetical protein